MKMFLKMLLAVLVALFIKDRVDLYLLEHQHEITFNEVQTRLLGYLRKDDDTEKANNDRGAINAGSRRTQPAVSVTPADDKEKAWQEWYAAIAPRECLKSVLGDDFVPCTDLRIKARKAFESSWQPDH